MINKNNSDLYAKVAHDLKSPLQQIRALSELLNNEKLSLEEKNELLTHITKVSQHMEAYIDEILKYDRSKRNESLKNDSINLHKLVREIEPLLPYSEYQIRKIFMVNQITTNKKAIKQILLNLLTNAIKYNHNKKAYIDIYTYQNYKFYEIHVKDNGIGIEPGFHDLIFKPFQVLTNKDRFGNTGNGLGLATVKELVTKLGGTIHLISEYGKGSTFSINIPIL